MNATYVWLPSERGERLHAVPAERTVVDGRAVTACSPAAPMELSRDTAGPDFRKCGHCVRSIASGGSCGTYAGFSRHKKRKEMACAPCRKAGAEYQRQYRERNPQSADRGRVLNAARSRAMTRLAAEFPDRFQVLLDEELRSTEGGEPR